MTVNIDEIIARYSTHPRFNEKPRSNCEVDIGEIDLTPFVRGDEPPVSLEVLFRDDGQGLLYRPGVTDIHGDPGTGKTLLVQYAIAEILKSGAGIVLLDFEGTARTFVERLRSFGVADDVIMDGSRVLYANMPGKITPEHVAALQDRMDSLAAAFVGVDAMLPALARSGLDDNSNSDVAHYFENNVRPLADAGVAVVTIDHIVKDSAGRGRGARGAGAKLQFVDLSYSLKPVKSFSRHEAGSFKLLCDKDRHGNFAAGSTVATVKVTPTDRLISMTLEAPQDVSAEGWKPTGLMEKVSRYLERHREANPVPPSKTEICDAVPGRKEWKIEAIDALAAGSWITPEKHGNSVRYWLNTPYREGDSPSDVPAACSPFGALVGPGTREHHAAPEPEHSHGFREHEGPSSEREKKDSPDPKRFTR